MPKILILADDLTGANDTGAAIRALGHEVYTVVHHESNQEHLESYYCVSVNLDSRNLSAAQAAEIVHQATNRFADKQIQLYAKRIDSTLRGNLVSECDALLEELGSAYIMAITPAFPNAGRTYYDDTVFVNGIPLLETVAAKDPKSPATSNSPAEIFKARSQFGVGRIPLEALQGPEIELIHLLNLQIQNGNRNIIFEAKSNEDLQRIAAALLKLETPFCVADSGPLTAAVAKFWESGTYAERDDVLAVVGSVNEVTKEQIKYLLADKAVCAAVLDVEQLLTSPDNREHAIQQAIDTLLRPTGGAKSKRLLMLSSVMSEKRVSLKAYSERDNKDEEKLSRRINHALAQAAYRVCLKERGIGGLFICGGDITVAVCEVFGASGMRVLDEVIPLAVCGELMAENGTPYLVITKGGMVGRTDSVAVCMDDLREKLQKRGRKDGKETDYCSSNG